MKITLKRTISSLLVFAMVFAMLPALGLTAHAATGAGSIDLLVSTEPGKLHISGWGMDLDHASDAVSIHVYIGGPAGTEGIEFRDLGNTNISRPDVNEAYKDYGASGDHGFDATISTTKTGTQEIVVYAITADGTNPEIARATVYILPEHLAYGDSYWNMSVYDECAEKPDGVYRITSAANSGFSLNIAGGSAADGADLQLLSNAETNAQLFHLRRVHYNDLLTGNGANETRTIVSFMNLNSQRFLDEDTTENSNKVQQYGTLANTANRQWVMHNNGDGTYSFESVSSPGYYMTIEGGSLTDGATIGIALGDGSIYQKFCLNAEYVYASGNLTALEGGLRSGEYRLWDGSSAQVLQVVDASTAEGSAFTLSTAGDHYTHYQIFDIQKDENGWYTIRNINSGLYVVSTLDTKGSSQFLVQQQFSTGDEAKWAIIPRVRTDGGLSYWFVNKATGLYLTRFFGAILCPVDNAQENEQTSTDTYNYTIDTSGFSWNMEGYVSYASTNGQEITNDDTGIAAGQFDTSDTISLPIKIYDYTADGMLFEYSTDGDQDNTGFGLGDPSNTTSYPAWTMGQITTGSNTFRDAYNADGTGATYFQKDFWTTSTDGLNKIFLVQQSALVDYNEGGTSDTIDLSYLEEYLGYSIFGEMTSGNATLGLVKPTLRVLEDGTKLLEYNDEVVAFVADLLEKSLAGRDEWGTAKATGTDVAKGQNYGDYGTDVAGLLAAQLYANNNSTRPTYSTVDAERSAQILADLKATMAADQQKGLIGTWEDCKANVKTYTDAAYFLLNNLCYPGSYNTPQNKFDYLVLSKAELTNGKTAYVFDSNFSDTYDYDAGTTNSAVKYDFAAKTISNTSMMGKPVYRFLFPFNLASYYNFLPIWETETTQDPTPNYTNENYNYVLQCNGKFTYTESDDLFFNFAGDDDVYLFINGQLVLDLGGAHSLATMNMDLNDYVYAAREAVANGTATEREIALALVDGEEYSFDFYYMERHSPGANMRIATNIRVSDLNLDTDKKAYRGGVELNNGGLVNVDENVEYSFVLGNPENSITNLYNLTFADAKLGVTIDYSNGLTVTGSKTLNSAGAALTVADLKIYFTNEQGTTSLVELNGTTAAEKNEALKLFLQNVSGIDGLEPGCSIEIRGIYYDIDTSDFSSGRFTNTLQVTANQNADGSGDTYQSSANMVVCIASCIQYYQWSEHSLSVTASKFTEDVNTLLKSNSALVEQIAPATALNAVTGLQLCDMRGNAVQNSYVSASADGISITYSTPGTYTFYVKATDGSSTLVVPVQVYVVDVEDSAFVLDYGLKVKLGKALTANDTLSVAGKTTSYTFEALTSTTLSYKNNSVTCSDGAQTVDSTYGQYSIVGNSIEYDPTKFIAGADTVYVAIRVHESATPSGAVGDVNINTEVEMYKKITILPASMGYYEDNFSSAITYTVYDVVDEDGTLKDEVNADKAWETVKDANASDTLYQDANRPGVNSGLLSDMIYGYDETYTAMGGFSAGSAHKVTVDADTSAKAKFTFIGTGFDVISLSSNTTGTIIVTAKNETTGASTTYMVDTYYGYTYGDPDPNDEDDMKQWYVTSGDNAMYQIPVIKVEGLAYGTYDVEIYVAYNSWFDNTGAEEYSFYLDAIRVYDPANDGVWELEDGTMDTTIQDAYISDGEYDPTYQELRDLLINPSNDTTFQSGTTVDGTVFIDGKGNVSGTTNASLADYVHYGPNNEVYLDAGQSVAFNMNYSDNVRKVQLALKCVWDNATVSIYGLDGTTKVKERTITLCTSTDMYYDISDLNGYTVVIENISEKGAESDTNEPFVSITNIKTTHNLVEETGSENEVENNDSFITMDLATAESVVAYMNAQSVVAPTLSLNYPTVSFEDEIFYNVYFDVDDMSSVTEMGLITFDSKLESGTIDDALTMISGYDVVNGVYTARTNGIPAKNMGDAVYFKAYAKLTDGTYVYSDIAGYNAIAYANTVLSSDASDSAKALVVAMLNYGAAAQVQFGYNTDSLMNAGLTAEQLALVDAYSESMVDDVVAADSSKVGLFVHNGGYADLYPTVSFEGAFSINYYFETAYTPDAAPTFYYWDAATYASADELTAENATGTVTMVADGDCWVGTVDGIAAKQLDQTYYIAGVYTVGDTTYYSPVVSYSLGSYCETLAAQGNAFGAATAVYGYYAEAYFAN